MLILVTIAALHYLGVLYVPWWCYPLFFAEQVFTAMRLLAPYERG